MAAARWEYNVIPEMDTTLWLPTKGRRSVFLVRPNPLTFGRQPGAGQGVHGQGVHVRPRQATKSEAFLPQKPTPGAANSSSMQLPSRQGQPANIPTMPHHAASRTSTKRGHTLAAAPIRREITTTRRPVIALDMERSVNLQLELRQAVSVLTSPQA